MTGTGAGGSGFLVASAFTWTNCTPCGFCTPAAGEEKRPKPVRASWTRKAATLVIESRWLESLAVRESSRRESGQGYSPEKDDFRESVSIVRWR